jgi:hypothetical protein
LNRRVLSKEETDKGSGVGDWVMRRADQGEDVIEDLSVSEAGADQHREAVLRRLTQLSIRFNRLKEQSSCLDHWKDVCVNLKEMKVRGRKGEGRGNLLSNFLSSLHERNEVPVWDAVHQNSGESRARVGDCMTDLSKR